jgi:hypothetical protein
MEIIGKQNKKYLLLIIFIINPILSFLFALNSNNFLASFVAGTIYGAILWTSLIIGAFVLSFSSKYFHKENIQYVFAVIAICLYAVLGSLLVSEIPFIKDGYKFIIENSNEDNGDKY